MRFREESIEHRAYGLRRGQRLELGDLLGALLLVVRVVVVAGGVAGVGSRGVLDARHVGRRRLAFLADHEVRLEHYAPVHVTE